MKRKPWTCTCAECEAHIEEMAEMLWQLDQYRALLDRLGIDWKPGPWKTANEVN